MIGYDNSLHQFPYKTQFSIVTTTSMHLAMESVFDGNFVHTVGSDGSFASVNNNTIPYPLVNNNTEPYPVLKNNNTKPYQVMPTNNKYTNPYQYPHRAKPYQLPNQNASYQQNNNTISKLKSHNSNLTSMDSGYNALRRQVPTFPYEKRLSKIDTLQLTIAYINLLRDILSSQLKPVEYIQNSLKEEDKEGKLEWNTSDLTARLHWVDWARIGESSGEH